MVCTRPSAAPYSLITRSRSAADGKSPRQVMRVRRPPKSSKITVWGHCTRSPAARPPAPAAVAVDDARGRHDLIEGDAVLIIAAVRAVHDEAPDAARPEFEARRRGGETVRSPPLRQMLCIGPDRKHQLPRRIDLAIADDRARIAPQVEAICGGHVSCLWLSAVSLAALSDRRRDGRGFPRKSGDSVRANRRYPSAPALRCGRGETALRGCARSARRAPAL